MNRVEFTDYDGESRAPDGDGAVVPRAGGLASPRSTHPVRPVGQRHRPGRGVRFAPALRRSHSDSAAWHRPPDETADPRAARTRPRDSLLFARLVSVCAPGVAAGPVNGVRQRVRRRGHGATEQPIDEARVGLARAGYAVPFPARVRASTNKGPLSITGRLAKATNIHLPSRANLFLPVLDFGVDDPWRRVVPRDGVRRRLSGASSVRWRCC